MVQARSGETQSQAPEAILSGSFPFDPKPPLKWLDVLVYQPPPTLSPDDYIVLLAWRREPLRTVAISSGSRGAPATARQLLERACRDANARDPNWASSSYASNVPPKAEAGDKKKSFADELWDAFTAPTNLWGTAVGIGMTADALIHSLPLKWHVTMQRGAWELYDENATHRTRKYGRSAIGRSRVPPKIVLRARGARIPWMWQAGARVGSNSTTLPAAGARTVAEALKIVKADTMKLMPKGTYDVLKGRATLGGSAVGLALTVLPQAYVDARDAGLFSNTDADHWKNFIVKEAESQPANLAGFAAGMLAGVAVAAAGATSAPVLIVAGLAFGALGQASFNAWGISKDLKAFAESRLFAR